MAASPSLDERSEVDTEVTLDGLRLSKPGVVELAAEASATDGSTTTELVVEDCDLGGQVVEALGGLGVTVDPVLTLLSLSPESIEAAGELLIDAVQTVELGAGEALHAPSGDGPFLLPPQGLGPGTPALGPDEIARLELVLDAGEVPLSP